MAAKKVGIARALSGMRIVTNQGVDLGNLVDLIIEAKTGKIKYLVVSLKSPNIISKFGSDEIYVPYDAVLSIGDFIIVDETMIQKK